MSCNNIVFKKLILLLLQKDIKGRWLCCSFSGLFVLDRQYGIATDYLKTSQHRRKQEHHSERKLSQVYPSSG